MAKLTPFEERLKARYGQARFNPAAGQTAMSYREWMDRHPGLKDGAKAKASYEAAVSEEGGKKYQAKNPDWRTKDVVAPEVTVTPGVDLTNVGSLVSRGASSSQPRGASGGQLGGPDSPPGNESSRSAAAKRRIGAGTNLVRKPRLKPPRSPLLSHGGSD